MDRRYRLTSSTDIKRVRRTGKSHAHPLAILVASSNDQPISRFGVTAGKIVGGAVHRNRAKRLLREALRSHLPNLSPGWDILLIARPTLIEADWTQVSRAVFELLKRAGLYEENDKHPS